MVVGMGNIRMKFKFKRSPLAAPLFTRCLAIGLLSVASLSMANTGSAAAVIYNNSGAFSAQLGASLTDTYSPAEGYTTLIYTDAAMTAVFGQTAYHATEFTNFNLVGNIFAGDTDGEYCSACNGSFVLGFGNTSFTQGAGVFGVGFDVDYNPNSNEYAFVTFADNSTLNVLLDPQSTFGPGFVPNYFGITSDLGISSISIGAINGGVTSNTFVIDNLQIGSAASTRAVPEPATWAMMLVGLGAIGAAMRRKKAKSA